METNPFDSIGTSREPVRSEALNPFANIGSKSNDENESSSSGKNTHENNPFANIGRDRTKRQGNTPPSGPSDTTAPVGEATPRRRPEPTPPIFSEQPRRTDNSANPEPAIWANTQEAIDNSTGDSRQKRILKTIGAGSIGFGAGFLTGVGIDKTLDFFGMGEADKLATRQMVKGLVDASLIIGTTYLLNRQYKKSIQQSIASGGEVQDPGVIARGLGGLLKRHRAVAIGFSLGLIGQTTYDHMSDSQSASVAPEQPAEKPDLAGAGSDQGGGFISRISNSMSTFFRGGRGEGNDNDPSDRTNVQLSESQHDAVAGTGVDINDSPPAGIIIHPEDGDVDAAHQSHPLSPSHLDQSLLKHNDIGSNDAQNTPPTESTVVDSNNHPSHLDQSLLQHDKIGNNNDSAGSHITGGGDSQGHPDELQSPTSTPDYEVPVVESSQEQLFDEYRRIGRADVTAPSGVDVGDINFDTGKFNLENGGSMFSVAQNLGKADDANWWGGIFNAIAEYFLGKDTTGTAREIFGIINSGEEYNLDTTTLEDGRTLREAMLGSGPGGEQKGVMWVVSSGRDYTLPTEVHDPNRSWLHEARLDNAAVTHTNMPIDGGTNASTAADNSHTHTEPVQTGQNEIADTTSTTSENGVTDIMPRTDIHLGDGIMTSPLPDNPDAYNITAGNDFNVNVDPIHHTISLVGGNILSQPEVVQEIIQAPIDTFIKANMAQFSDIIAYTDKDGHKWKFIQLAAIAEGGIENWKLESKVGDLGITMGDVVSNIKNTTGKVVMDASSEGGMKIFNIPLPV